MRLIVLTAIALATLPTALSAHVAGCVPEQYEVHGGVMADTTVAGAPYYAFFEIYHPDGWSTWIYEETNGLAGLQRGDEVVANETCGHPSDTIIF